MVGEFKIYTSLSATSCLLSISEDKDVFIIVFIIIQQKKRSGALLSCHIILKLRTKHNATYIRPYHQVTRWITICGAT